MEGQLFLTLFQSLRISLPAKGVSLMMARPRDARVHEGESTTDRPRSKGGMPPLQQPARRLLRGHLLAEGETAHCAQGVPRPARRRTGRESESGHA